MPNRQIDFSDIPESTDEELRRAKRVGNAAAAQLIAIKIKPRLLAEIQRLARRYSKSDVEMIHDLLERATRQAA